MLEAGWEAKDLDLIPEGNDPHRLIYHVLVDAGTGKVFWFELKDYLGSLPPRHSRIKFLSTSNFKPIPICLSRKGR